MPESIYTTEFRQLDSQMVMWRSHDPVFQPWQSPYNSMDGNPVSLNDVRGNTATATKKGNWLTGRKVVVEAHLLFFGAAANSAFAVKTAKDIQDAWNEVLHWSMKGRSIEHISETFHARLINPKISWWGHNAAFNYNSAEAISKIDLPILILNPGDDLYELTPRAQKYLQNPESRIMDLEDWSHGF